MARKIIYKLLLWCFAIIYGFNIFGQSKENVIEENIAKYILLKSDFSEFIKYDSNIEYYLKTPHGNLEFGPRGIDIYIHETSHVYDAIKSSGQYDKMYYWRDSSILLGVDIGKNFPESEKIFSLLPGFVQTQTITDAYITCKNRCMANFKGIYGLLEEFNAYSLAPRFLFKMYSYFDSSAYTKTRQFWRGYLDEVFSSWMKFYYFNIYFSTYLKYLDNFDKTYFQFIILDLSFKSAFNNIYSSYLQSLLKLDTVIKIIKGKYFKNIGYVYDFFNEYKTMKFLSEADSVKSNISLLLSKNSTLN